MGTVVGQIAGEPPVVPRAQLLPLAARQSVLAGNADSHSRYVRLSHRRSTSRTLPPGQEYLRYGSACSSGSWTRLPETAYYAKGRSIPRSDRSSAAPFVANVGTGTI